ncbi:hypothetical protein BN1088_1433332 [Sphingobacterium sp. PM2-P1-29]|nr:hypothetical protein BN1088_1433332 [Sphingobacterium sp. PM2-P1-29]
MVLPAQFGDYTSTSAGRIRSIKIKNNYDICCEEDKQYC